MAVKISREEIRAIYRQGEEATILLVESLVERINVLEVEVMQLKDEIAKLKGQISKDSHNSSKPPSSDLFRRHPKSMREKSNRPTGGQPGHEGHSLRQVENPDRIVKHRLEGRCECGRKLSKGKRIGSERHQVFDLPPIKLMVTEHRCEIKECVCGRPHTAAFPEGAEAPVQYGERIRAIVTYLSSYQLLPQERTSKTMADLFGVPLSEGTIHNMREEAYHRLSETEEAIKGAIRHAPVIHTDETGTYVAGERLWKHVYGTPDFTFYFCHAQRGGKAVDAQAVLPEPGGRLMHDGAPAYLDIECLHALCNAHHLRDLIFIKEQFKQRWAGTMIGLLCRIKKTVDRAKEAGRESLAPATLRNYQHRYERILTCGYRQNPPSEEPRRPGQRGKLKQSPARNLLDRLKKYEDETLAFMHDFSVPFDNNLSERDLRMEKVRQKISGCFRSFNGAQIAARIRGFISTAQKHGLNVFEQLLRCFDPQNRQLILLPIKAKYP